MLGSGSPQTRFDRVLTFVATPSQEKNSEQGFAMERASSPKLTELGAERHITFSKRKAGIMKKVCLLEDAQYLRCTQTEGGSIDQLQAYELSKLTGTEVLLLVVSETGLVYTFTT